MTIRDYINVRTPQKAWDFLRFTAYQKNILDPVARAFKESQAMRPATSQELVSPEYLPGFCKLGSLENVRARVLQLEDAIAEKIPTEKGRSLFRKNITRIIEMNPVDETEPSIAEAVLKLGRLAATGNMNSATFDPFAEANEKAHGIGRELAKNLLLKTNLYDINWMVLLAQANALEMFSTKPKYEKPVEELRETVANPEKFSLSLNRSSLFTTHVLERPQKIAFFPDNIGEIWIDLCWILQLAKKWEKNSTNWTFGIIGKSLPATTDATKHFIDKCIYEPGSPVAELKRFVRSKQVIVFDGGPKAQGTNLPHLSQKVGNYLLEVKNSDGTGIAKGLYNLETLQGVNFLVFSIFKAKTDRTLKAMGLSTKGALGLVNLLPGARSYKLQ